MTFSCWLNNNNDNNRDDIYGAVIMASNCESSPGSFDECRLSAKVAANPQTKPTDFGLRVHQKEMAATVHIHHRHFIITQPESWYSFYRPTKGGRLSRPRHCSKGVQPVPEAVYCSGCRDKHNCPRWDSNLGPLTPQSGILPLGHCNTAAFFRGYLSSDCPKW